MSVRNGIRRWEPCFEIALATLAPFCTVALIMGCWIEAGILLACAALAAVGVSRHEVLFITGLFVYFGLAVRAMLWLFGPGGTCSWGGW